MTAAMLCLLAAGIAPAREAAVYRIPGPVASGEPAFVDEELPLVPVAGVVEVDEATLARERERRRAWLARPAWEIVDELMRRDPGEGEAMDRFRRWLADRYVESLKAHPEAAAMPDPRRLVSLGLRAVRIRDSGIETVAEIPLWQGDLPVRQQVGRHGGASWTVDLTNAWAGALPGPHRVAVWAWPDRAAGEPVAVLLDPRALDAPRPLADVLPLAWLDSSTLVALARREGGWALVRLGLDDEGRLRDERVIARPPSLHIATALLPGARSAVLARGFELFRLDLADGRIAPLDVDGRTLRTTTCGWPTVAAGRIWLAEGPVGRRLLALVPAGAGFHVATALPLPWGMGEPAWCSPLAARGPLLVLGRRRQHVRELGRGARGAAGLPWLDLFVLDVSRGGMPLPLELPPVEHQWASRPVAISPDGRWLAVRIGADELRVVRLADAAGRAH